MIKRKIYLTSGRTLNQREIAAIKRNEKMWNVFGSQFGWQLRSFSYDHSATFEVPNPNRLDGQGFYFSIDKITKDSIQSTLDVYKNKK